jgi:hypothetical protein
MRKPNIVNMKFGSHLYGLNTPNSDVDYKGIFMPTLEELLLGTYPKTIVTSTGPEHAKNGAGDIDTEVISLPNFIKHACTGETFAIDMLHCTEPTVSNPIWEELVANRTKFYSKNLKAFVGYVKQQAAKYGVKGSRLADIKGAIDSLTVQDPNLTLGEVKSNLYFGKYAEWKVKPNPSAGHDNEFYLVNGKMYQSTNTVQYTIDRLQQMYDGYGHRAKLAEQNEGVDWKAMSHALRAGYQARDIYRMGDFSYPLKETEFLKQVKTGNLSFDQVANELESLVAEIEMLSENSNLPEQVDVEFWNSWLVSVYAREFNLNV